MFLDVPPSKVAREAPLLAKALDELRSQALDQHEAQGCTSELQDNPRDSQDAPREIQDLAIEPRYPRVS